MRNQSVSLLWNNSSGWSDGEKELELVRSRLTRDGAEVQVTKVSSGMDLQEQSRALVTSGPAVLVAAGGDGTLNAAAGGLLAAQAMGGMESALGIIPAGTLNHFARDLHIPIDPEDAAGIIGSGTPQAVDVASVNGRIFLNNAVLGLFPNYRATREALERRGFGRTAFGRFLAVLAGMVRVLWRLPHLTVELQVAGQHRRLRTPFVLIGNNEHRMQGFALGERASLREGTLWVYVMRPCSRWGLIRMIANLLLNRVSRHSVFEIYQATSLRIDAKPRRIGVGVDGEMVRMRAPLHFQILPQALRVIVPELE